jgi:hypothetical protein
MSLATEQTDAAQTKIYPFIHNSRRYIYAGVEILLILLGFGFMLKSFPILYFYDGIARLNAMQELLHGTISPVSYSLVGPLFSLPLWVVQKWHPTWWWDPQKYNVYLLMAFMLATYISFRKRIDRSLLRKFFLILIVASMFSDQVKYFGGETFTATFVGFGGLAITLAPAWLGWITIVLGVVNTPATLAGLFCLSLKKSWDDKRWRYGLAIVAAGSLILAESWIRRGSPFNSGYGDQKFSTPFIIGLLGIIFSFDKGLLFFTPGIFLPVKKYIYSLEQGEKEKLFSAYTLWISFVVGLILIYSAWWAWDGALFWGPRFFLIACIPASFALAVRLHKPGKLLLANLLTLIVFAWSLYVGIDGALFDMNDLSQFCVTGGYKNMPLCQYDPYYSVLWRPIANHIMLSRSEEIFIAYSLIVFVYLAMPTMISITRQIKDIYGIILRSLHMKMWTF